MEEFESFRYKKKIENIKKLVNKHKNIRHISRLS